MSRTYHATFAVGDDDSAIENTDEAIVYRVITRLWPADDRCDHEVGGQFVFSGTHSLYGGESEDEFVQRACRTLWLALKRYVPIEIVMTDMENLPYETYDSKYSEYIDFIANRKQSLEG